MELAAINSPATAFIAGLVTSLHCAAMCGPLSCTLMNHADDETDATTVISVYHLCRLASYTLLGGLAGGIGRLPLTWLSTPIVQWLPWLLVLFFLALALRWDRHLPQSSALARFSLALHGWMRSRSRTKAAAALGLGTPLLPCGPLYLVLTLSLLSGSAVRGMGLMLAFALGTVPLLWLAQAQFNWVRRSLSPLWLTRIRLVLGLGVAAILSWRLRGTLGFTGPSPFDFACF